MKCGELLEVIATDRACLREIPALVVFAGDRLVDIRQHNGRYHFFVRRQRAACRKRARSLLLTRWLGLAKPQPVRLHRPMGWWGCLKSAVRRAIALAKPHEPSANQGATSQKPSTGRLTVAVWPGMLILMTPLSNPVAGLSVNITIWLSDSDQF